MITGNNNDSNNDKKHVINIKESNENLMNFFNSNIDNLFDINKKYLREDIKGKIFDKNNKIPIEDLGEILVQLYFIEKGYEYIIYSYNIESSREKSKNFDGIFLKDDEVYYLEVKTKLETNKENFIKDINKKISSAYRDALKTKINGPDEYAKLSNYCRAHFLLKTRNYNFSKTFDELCDLVDTDTSKEKFNLISAGTVNSRDKTINLHLNDIKEITSVDKKIKKNLVLGLNHSIIEKFISEVEKKL